MLQPLNQEQVVEQTNASLFRGGLLVVTTALALVLTAGAVTAFSLGGGAFLAPPADDFQCVLPDQSACTKCSDANTCTACLQLSVSPAGAGPDPVDYKLVKQGNKTNCVANDAGTSITFYTYHAKNGQNYSFENVDTASAAGVMWYTHNEVVNCEPKGTCTRKFNIDRIQRMKVTVRNPPMVYNFDPYGKFPFGRYTDFTFAKCNVAGPKAGEDCGAWYQRYGYFVGCEKPSGDQDKYGASVAWYSWPGQCPLQDFNNKSADCMKQQHGGQCATPDGTPDCTWSAEDAGEVLLDDLAQTLPNYYDWCKAGGCEYDRTQDKGDSPGFWDGLQDATKDANRVQALLDAFKKKYPDKADLPEPSCHAF